MNILIYLLQRKHYNSKIKDKANKYGSLIEGQYNIHDNKQMYSISRFTNLCCN